MTYVSNLDQPLLRLSATDQFSLRDAVQGVHIFGGIGSGKTTGSGAALASAYLRAGMGGIVLCAKPDEVGRWIAYARANGRENSLMLFGEHGGGFNFITYELARHGLAGCNSVVECLMRVIEAARLTNPNARASSEPFWEDATRQILRNTIPVLYSATGSVAIPDIIRFVASSPASLAELESQAWQESSFMMAMLVTANRAPVIRLAPEHFDQIASYWRDQFARLDPKTRGNISISLSTSLDRFTRGRLANAFCGVTNLVPEMTFHGAIIVLDMSAHTWNEDGIIGQQLFKFIWQRAVLARGGLDPHHADRPVFCWADEAQAFVNAQDAQYQAACRSSKACTVYLTQSLPTYYASIGGDQPKHQADMLLANFITKVFHNNPDPETNRWAADTIGRSIQHRANFSEGKSTGTSGGMNMGESENWGWSGTNSSFFSGGHSSGNWSSSSSGGGGDNWGRSRSVNDGESTTTGFSEVLDYEIEPADFSRFLKTGGPANSGMVTGVWFQAGKTFQDSGRNYLAVSFRQ